MPRTVIGLFMVIYFTGTSWVLAWDREKIDRLEQRVQSYDMQSEYKDDPYGLTVVKAALKSLKEGSGGIGACLVNATSGEIVAYGRNRQYTHYFRSDLHAEMDLLNRYENRVKKTSRRKGGWNPRDCQGLVLITSVEPCPMCLTRIINAGIKTLLYVVEDQQGGMVTRIDQLPPFWREFAADREFRQANCSPALRRLALDLFHFSNRSFAKNRDK